MPSKSDWLEFYKLTKGAPPSDLLVKALGYVPAKGNAVDIGGGALKDSRYLLEQGFDVTVMDQEPLMIRAAGEIKSVKLHPILSSFADFDFPEKTFDLASAMFALPFNRPETFDNVFQKIKKSLVKGGILCGQFFGVRDAWSSNSTMTFHTKEQAKALLDGMEIIAFNEKEWDGKRANGTPKHWHVFHFIARKE